MSKTVIPCSTNKVPVIAVTDHHEMCPSSAHRWMNCPGSVALCRQIPKGTNEEAAAYTQEGTRAHKLMELCLQDNLKSAELGPEYQEPFSDLEMRTEVDAFVKFVNGIPGHRMIETRVMVGSEWGEYVDGIYGHPDVTIIQQETDPDFESPIITLHILDFKYGRGVRVRSWSNPQLLLYAAAWMSTYDFIWSEIDKITFWIYQPRFAEHDANWTIERREFEEYFSRINEGARLALEPGAPLVPDDDQQCQFCNAKPVCPARVSPLLDFVDDSKFVKELETPRLVSFEKLVEVLPRLEDFIRIAKSVRDYVEDLAIHGAKVKGYKLVRGNSKQSWTDEKLAIERLALHMPLVAFTEMRSVAAITKVLGGKSLAAPIIGDLIVKVPSGKLRMVRSIGGAEEDFAEEN